MELRGGGGRPCHTVCSGPGYRLQGPYHCVLRLSWAGLRQGDLVPLPCGTEEGRGGRQAVAERERSCWPYNENACSFAAGAPGPGAGPRSPAQVRPCPQHCAHLGPALKPRTDPGEERRCGNKEEKNPRAQKMFTKWPSSVQPTTSHPLASISDGAACLSPRDFLG